MMRSRFFNIKNAGMFFIGSVLLHATVSMLRYITDIRQQRTLEELVRPGAVPVYMRPNQVEGEAANDHRRYNQGQVYNIYYLKVHKAGSTTLQNIMYRYALSQNLRIALFKTPYGMTYPEKPSPDLLIEGPTQRDFRPFHVICDHTVYDAELVKPYMNPGFKSIAIIREPFAQFLSAFNFFNVSRLVGGNTTEEKMRRVLSLSRKEVEAAELAGVKRLSRVMNIHIWNPQAKHFDYKENITGTDKSSIGEFLHDIDEKFDLIMLTERFDLGLIQMKRLFHWSMKDIIYTQLFSHESLENARQSKGKRRAAAQESKWGSERRNLEQSVALWRLQALHQTVAPVDYAIYQYFLQKVTDQFLIENETFWTEVQEFRLILKQINAFCNTICDKLNSTWVDYFDQSGHAGLVASYLASSQLVVPRGSTYDSFSVTLLECAMMRLDTRQYQPALIMRQHPRYPCTARGRLQPHMYSSSTVTRAFYTEPYCHRSSYAFHNFPWTVVKKQVLGQC